MKYTLVKLGGSIITDPGSEGFFNQGNTSRLAGELFPFHRGCILIHGTGHIGKPPAIRYNYVDTGIIEKDKTGIALGIKNSIRQLNQRVINELLKAGIPAVPMDILLFSEESDEGADHRLLTTRLVQMVGNGLVPVCYGDLLPLADGTFKVISSDYLTLLIARILKPGNVVFLTDVKGVYAHHPDMENPNANEILPYVTADHLNLLETSENDRKDVSGGMRKKIETALEVSRHCQTCFIGSGYTENVLADFFNKKPVTGTIVKHSA